MISHVKTVAVYVEDQEVAREFYTEQLGFEVHVERGMGPEATWLEVAPPDTRTHFVLYPRDMMDGWEEMQASVTLYTEDVEATYEELDAAGVTFTQPPEEQHWGTFAAFEDPDGNDFLLTDTP